MKDSMPLTPLPFGDLDVLFDRIQDEGPDEQPLLPFEPFRDLDVIGTNSDGTAYGATGRDRAQVLDRHRAVFASLDPDSASDAAPARSPLFAHAMGSDEAALDTFDRRDGQVTARSAAAFLPLDFEPGDSRRLDPAPGRLDAVFGGRVATLDDNARRSAEETDRAVAENLRLDEDPDEW